MSVSKDLLCIEESLKRTLAALQIIARMKANQLAYLRQWQPEGKPS